ncbi:unnamed protein product, partial [Ectocarpus sp. 12 AP-2014]
GYTAPFIIVLQPCTTTTPTGGGEDANYLKTASSQSNPAPVRVAHGSSVLCFL